MAESKIKTLSRTDGWFDGVGTADLRAWLRFWKNEKRSKGRALEASKQDAKFATMYRKDHVAMLEAEIEARTAARTKGGPQA